MKLINRKTRKAIDKSVRKALKRHGPALITGLASGLASSLATLAKTEAPNKGGKSNLAMMAERLEEALTPDGQGYKKKGHHAKKKHRHHDRDMTQQAQPAMT
jgi:hypothetical protein